MSCIFAVESENSPVTTSTFLLELDIKKNIKILKITLSSVGE